MPLDKGLVRRDHHKDYAFVIRKVERAHIGIKPQRIAYKEAKLLAKIEKRILKILKKAETADIRKVCSDTLFDAFRYSSLNKYAYKNKILGKERFSWELIFLISSGIIAFFLAFLLWLIGKLC